MNPVLAISVAFLALVALIVWVISDVPEGYEDEKGFHKGKEPVKKFDDHS